MGDSLITVVAILLATILMFVFPMLSVAERTDDISQIAVQTATVQFVDDIRATGKLQMSDYNSYVQKLAATGNAYEVEIERKILDENPSKKLTWASSKKIGENVYYSVYTSQILDEMQKSASTDKDRVYTFKEGDIVSVSVKNTNVTLSQMLRNFFLTVTGSETAQVEAAHAGMILLNGN